MNGRITRRIAAAAVGVVVAAGAVAAGPQASGAATPSLRAYAISADGTLMATFTTDKPGVFNWFRAIQGLVGDTSAIGLDYRVQDGLMYLVGNKGGIYSVKTPPAVDDVLVTKVSQLTIPLYGANFGVDFNPAADRLRVISDNGQNLRHNLHDHTTTEDAVLTLPPDQGTARGVTAAAYTNNDLNPDTATTLFDISPALDQVLVQSPANNGTLAATGKLTVDAGANAGFDIHSVLSGGKAVSLLGFATLTTSTGTGLYSVNLLNGEVSLVGNFPLAFTDLALTLTGS
ncbi:DUF4394 domain-containing protein [Actinosynnema pretiosum subsp. pretiosum]|uniref:DUF4394 domain-containing protein n=2 Tax=Actinosynnema TaxID=40566 RepID=C6WRL3_ACTMD|nr:DUF4394 domain-containing protein [Actinosynnema mirum]ACU36855.1 hypothetical protein Amir_2934 [Actinosynnema mirum DSM 43827]AXX30324.1 DNA polymerase I [Actinosynnema pretiosum subsp. pretiosum]QUF05521.1 DUF4394 domain-containing protein [Actinosynnema pretiosum subsp. pretiosum]